MLTLTEVAVYTSPMDYWQKQLGEPLFPALQWSKPETKRAAGKLLIIGGNLHTFSAPGQAFQAAVEAGVGVAKVLLPEGLRKTIGATLENAEFAPMNKSGSFAKEALAEWLDWSAWADCVLSAGDMGRNSETAIVLESFLSRYHGPLVITQDSLNLLTTRPQDLFARPHTVIVASFGQLQKVWPVVSAGDVIQYRSPLATNVSLLHEASTKLAAFVVTKHNEDVIVAVDGRVSTTKLPEPVWRVRTATAMAVWWLQNPSKPFEALTSAIHSA